MKETLITNLNRTH
jgi:predicted metalloendopeptidase